MLIAREAPLAASGCVSFSSVLISVLIESRPLDADFHENTRRIFNNPLKIGAGGLVVSRLSFVNKLVS